MLQSWRFKRAAIACALLGCLFASVTLVWLKLDRASPTWDDAWYLSNSLGVYDALTQHGVFGFLTKLNSIFGVKAPLIAALPTPFYLLLGRHWHAAFLVNIASMAVLFASLAWLGRKWRSGRAAVFAIAAAGAMPLLYGLARWYMVEYVIAALAAAMVCILMEPDGLRRDRDVMAWGVLFGFGLLLKITFPLYALPPFVYMWLKSGRRARPLIVAGIPAVALALPWYAGHLGPAFTNALHTGYGASVTMYGTGPILSLRTIATYLSRVAEIGVSWYFTGLAGILCLYALWKRLPGMPAMLVCWLAPFIVFLFATNKDVRFTAPLLGAVALVIAILLDRTLPATAGGTAFGGMLLLFPIVQMFAVSFGIPYAVADTTGYTHRYNPTPGIQDEMLRQIAADSRVHAGEKVLILVGADRPFLNADNVELTANAMQLPFHVETTAHENDLGLLRARLSQASYFVYKTGGDPESAAFNPQAGDLLRIASGDPQFTEIPYSGVLPDGGIARVLKNLRPAQNGVNGTFVRNAPGDTEEFAVDFGGVLALTNMSIAISPGEAIVKFRWRCEKPPVRDYWSFTHLIDAQGRMVAQRDHRLLGGEPPLISWRSGDAGEEEIHLPLAVGKLPAGLRVRFGLYDPPSGERLAVGTLQGVAAGRFSAVDHGTALIALAR